MRESGRRSVDNPEVRAALEANRAQMDSMRSRLLGKVPAPLQQSGVPRQSGDSSGSGTALERAAEGAGAMEHHSSSRSNPFYGEVRVGGRAARPGARIWLRLQECCHWLGAGVCQCLQCALAGLNRGPVPVTCRTAGPNAARQEAGRDVPAQVCGCHPCCSGKPHDPRVALDVCRGLVCQAPRLLGEVSHGCVSGRC